MLQKNLNVLQDSHHGCHRQPANWKRVAASSEKKISRQWLPQRRLTPDNKTKILRNEFLWKT